MTATLPVVSMGLLQRPPSSQARRDGGPRAAARPFGRARRASPPSHEHEHADGTQSSGTASAPEPRHDGTRPRVAAAARIAMVTATSPAAKTTAMASEVGRAAFAEEGDVDGQVVAAGSDGDQRRRREAAPHGRLGRGRRRRRRDRRRSSARPGRSEQADRPRRPMASGTRPRRPTAAGENSNSRAAAAAATATSDDETRPPVRRRCGGRGPAGAPATMRRGHDAVVDVGADERGHGDADVGARAGRGQEGGQVPGSGIAGP